MIGSQKIISALHANWWLNLAGLLLSFGASIVLVRAMPPGLYAEYGAVLAMIGVSTLVFEAGANSGLTRYLAEAAQQQARGTFYRRMQRRRWLAAALCAAALIIFGPMYARHTEFERLTAQPWLFATIAAIVTATLVRLLAHYGLVALFETRTALLLQQGFQIARSAALAGIALAGGSLMHLVAGLFALAAIEAILVHRRLWRIIGGERAPVAAGFVNRAQGFGLLTIFDKACAMLGGGTVMLLLLAPNHPATTIAFLTLAIDLVGKVTSLTVMPMGNLVAPYLSQTSDDPAAQALAIGRVVKISSLLYCFSIGAALLVLPWFVPTIYGGGYAAAAWISMLLLLPTAFENWIRGSCSPALLRNGRYRDLVKVNVLQAVGTLATLALVWRQPVETVLIAVGSVRCAVAALNLVLLRMRRLVPERTYRVPLQGFAIALAGCAAAYLAGSLLRLPGIALAAAQLLLFGALFYLGLRALIFRDEDMLHLAHRIVGTRLKFFTRLLPAQTLRNA